MHDAATPALTPENPLYRMLEAVIFEQWIRFSWIAEDADGDFSIQIPAATAHEIGEDYPQFQIILTRLNGTIVDASMACSAVLAYAQAVFGENAAAVLEDPALQHEVARFHLWLHEQVDMLEAQPYNFDQWKSLFVASLAAGNDAPTQPAETPA